MEVGDLLFGRRIRQNHALEHATVTILTRECPSLAVSARSTSRGFTIFADLDIPTVRRCCDEALLRLCGGEADLAIHPNCGTNLAVGTSLVMIGSLFAISSLRSRTRIASALASSFAGIFGSRRLGQIVQRHVTTLPDLHDVRIISITRKRFLRGYVVEVLTEAIA